MIQFFKREDEEHSSLKDLPEHSSQSPLSVHSMTVAYHHKPVLWDIEYDAPAHSLIAIVGPNGAGKSTFIKAALGLIPKATGVVEFWGSDLQTSRNRIAYVPQRESVDWDFPVSALDVAAMGRYGKIGWFRKHSCRLALHCHAVMIFANSFDVDKRIEFLVDSETYPCQSC